MKPQTTPPTPHPEPASEGNPAYPSLEERERIVEEHKKHSEPVKKIPADLIAPPPDGHSEDESR